MKIEIGPYIVSRRTEYSKIQLFDKYTNKNITDDFPGVGEKIISDYKKQSEHPERYFKVENNELVNFESYDSIEYAFIPDTIRIIRKVAFQNTPIKEINLPPSLHKIECYGFANCCYLESINLPDSLTSIGAGAFQYCTSLKNVKLSNALQDIESQTFIGCIKLDNIYIPDSVLYILEGAFNGCKSLKNIRLSDKLKKIATGAFAYCDSLEKMDLSGCVAKFDSHIFVNCISLKEVIMPEIVSAFGEHMFEGCSSLQHVKLPSNLSILPSGIFDGCNSLKNVEIPEGIRQIDIDTFGSSGVKSLTIVHDIKKIHHMKVPVRIKIGKIKLTNLGIAYNSDIDTINISNNVKTINPDFFGLTGQQITTINYLGTSQEFEKFMKSNKALTKVLPNINNVNFLDNDKEYGVKEVYR